MKKQTAGVLLTNKDTSQVLVVINRDYVESGVIKYGLPKGKLNKGETRLECAMREFQEETGMVVSITDQDPKLVINKITYYIIKSHTMPDPMPKDTKEIGKCIWVPWREIYKHACNNGLRVIRERLRKHKSFLMG